MELKLITKREVENLLNEIRGYTSFIDEKAITIEHHSQLTINGINFEETSIKLPTLFMIKTLDETQIEVSIQKQQYASGVQPMVYFCILLRVFKNSLDLLGRSSAAGDKLIYVINKSNVLNLIIMMKVFGMASKRHNHDVVKILEILLEIIDRG
ncbi:MAG: R.Pab1 family restriction endonuclease [bacterium]|nr:R.Pab1 family restriction endonuclease [bacterium]